MILYEENQLYYLNEDHDGHKKTREKVRKVQNNLEDTIDLLQVGAKGYDLLKNDDGMRRVVKGIVNPWFGEPIFKAGCYLFTGYFTSGAEEWLNTKPETWRSAKQTTKLGEPRDGWTKEHWIPRTTVGKIIIDALCYNKDDYKVFDGNCNIKSVCHWIEQNTHLFCSIIISSEEENHQLNDLIQKKHFTFEQLLNLEHYKELGITLDRNKHIFKGYKKARKAKKYKAEQDDITLRGQKWSFVVKDDSFNYPQIITPAMKELSIN